MTRATIYGLAFVVIACGGSREHGKHEEDEHAHAEGAAAHGEGEQGLEMLHVEKDMLRDLRITTTKVSAREAGETVTALGEIRVHEDAYAEVGSPIPARVVRVLVSPGDEVKAGQPLVELESQDVGRARGALASARARVALARRTVERRRALVGDQIVTQSDLEAAEAELAQAQAEEKAAGQVLGTVGSSRRAGARFTLEAPLAGTVLERDALIGRLVDPEHPLFVIGDLARLWLVVQAFERDAVRMRVGRAVEVAFAALPGQSLPGQIARVGSRVDPTSRTIDVRIDVENRDRTLRPGMSGTAAIPVGEEGARVLAVPVASLQRLPEGWCVFLPTTEPGAFEIRKVGRGRDLTGAVEIARGLREGETVVVDGAFLLKAETEKARGGGAEHEH